MATTRDDAPASTQLAAADTNRLNLDPQRDQNYQQRKLHFLNQKTDRSIYNPHGTQDPVSPYEVLAGSIIAGSLLTGINSDLPGEVSAVYPTSAPPGRWLIERLKLCANKLAA